MNSDAQHPGNMQYETYSACSSHSLHATYVDSATHASADHGDNLMRHLVHELPVALEHVSNSRSGSWIDKDPSSYRHVAAEPLSITYVIFGEPLSTSTQLQQNLASCLPTQPTSPPRYTRTLLGSSCPSSPAFSAHLQPQPDNPFPLILPASPASPSSQSSGSQYLLHLALNSLKEVITQQHEQPPEPTHDYQLLQQENESLKAQLFQQAAYTQQQQEHYNEQNAYLSKLCHESKKLSHFYMQLLAKYEDNKQEFQKFQEQFNEQTAYIQQLQTANQQW